MWMARSTSQRRQQKLLHYIGPRNSFAVFERLNKSSRPTPFGGILKCNWRAAANSRCTLTYTLAAQTSCRHTFDGGGREFNSCSLVREKLRARSWARVPGSTPAELKIRNRSWTRVPGSTPTEPKIRCPVDLH
jgi:hypothetical protein